MVKHVKKVNGKFPESISVLNETAEFDETGIATVTEEAFAVFMQINGYEDVTPADVEQASLEQREASVLARIEEAQAELASIRAEMEALANGVSNNDNTDGDNANGTTNEGAVSLENPDTSEDGNDNEADTDETDKVVAKKVIKKAVNRR